MVRSRIRIRRRIITMKPIIIQIWKVCWRLMLCLTAISAITVSVLLFITYQDHIDSYYIDKELSEAVCSHRYYNRNESRIYNRDKKMLYLERNTMGSKSYGKRLFNCILPQWGTRLF